MEIPYEAQYLSGVAASVKRFKFMADRPMVLYITVRLALITASAVVPALAAVQSPALTWVAVLITVLTGLDVNFRWGDEWRHFRKAQLALARVQSDYEYRKSAIASGVTVGDVTTDAQNFAMLHDGVETLRSAEADDFFRFRIAEWKGGDKPKEGAGGES